MSYFDHFSNEQAKANKIARKILGEIAKRNGRSVASVIDAFKNQDVNITEEFWSLIRLEYPDFNRVEYCSGCNKFHLWHSDAGE